MKGVQMDEQMEKQGEEQTDGQATGMVNGQGEKQADEKTVGQAIGQSGEKQQAKGFMKRIIAAVVIGFSLLFGSFYVADVLQPDDPPVISQEETPNNTEDDPSKQDTDLLKHRKLADLPAHVQESYIGYCKVEWKGLQPGASSGTRAGGVYNNRNEVLPATNSKGEKLSFKEYDVNNKIANQNRDAERFVVSFNPDGTICDVYYTSDHYDSFTRVVDDKYR